MIARFERNSAVESGGAFFIKCTDIRTNQSTFADNSAEEDGGAMFAEDTYDLHFVDCTFNKNKAGTDSTFVHLPKSCRKERRRIVCQEFTRCAF